MCAKLILPWNPTEPAESELCPLNKFSSFRENVSKCENASSPESLTAFQPLGNILLGILGILTVVEKSIHLY